MSPAPLAALAAPRGTSTLRALAELRLRLTLRRLRGGGGVVELVARTTMLVMAVPVGLAFAVFAGVGTYQTVRTGSEIVAARAAVLLFVGIWQTWTVVAVTLSDRESFDLRRLLVYPVPPWQAYGYELLASVLGDPFALFWSLLLAGAFTGAALARPGAWPVALLALTYLFFAAATATLVSLLQELLARALRGRRVREIGVSAIYVALIVLLVWGGSGGLRVVFQGIRSLFALRWIAYPAALAAEAAIRLYRGRALEALPWVAGLGVAAFATAWVAYRLALADAMGGAEGGQARGAGRGRGWRLPGRTGPLLEKELKYLLRHPLAAVLALVVPAIAAAVGWRAVPLIPVEAGEVVRALPLFAFALYAQVVTQAFWLNAFGWDRGGARLWFLAPVRLADVLRAKNSAVRLLALAVFAGSAAALFATAGVPPPWVLVAALALHLGVGAWYVAAGNVVSILNPRPAAHSFQRGGSLSPVSALVGMAIVSAGTALFVPPVFLALHLDQPWVLAGGWLLLGAAGWAVRRAAFPATVQLLERRREAVLSAIAGEAA